MKQFEDDAAEQAKEAVSADKISALMVHGRDLADLYYEKEDLEQKLKNVNKKISGLEYSAIPEIMEEASLEELPIHDGKKITCKKEIKGSIPTPNQIEKVAKKDTSESQKMSQRRIAALSWLNNNNHGSIIKHELTVDLGKDAGNKIAQICDLVVELGFQYDVGETVNAQTLGALIRELNKNGLEIPYDTFAITNASRAQIK